MPKPIYVVPMASLPCYLECEPCATRLRRICWDCGAKIPESREMENNGYRSVTADHIHAMVIGGFSGASAAYRELCLECYRKDFGKAYPGLAYPV